MKISLSYSLCFKESRRKLLKENKPWNKTKVNNKVNKIKVNSRKVTGVQATETDGVNI